MTRTQLCIHVLSVIMLAGLISVSVTSCDLLGRDEAEAEPEDRWIGLTAVYDEALEDGAPVRRLVLVNFDDPSVYRVLARDSITAAMRPRLSPSGQLLVFEHHTSDRPPIGLLDVNSEEVRWLWVKSSEVEQVRPLLGTLEGAVWSPDGRGFYAGQSFAAGLGSYVYYYDFMQESVTAISRPHFGPAVIPYGLKGCDSLFVLSNDSEITGDSLPGFYFIDTKTGVYLERVASQHIQFVRRDGDSAGWASAAYNPAYNDELGLIAVRLNVDVEGGHTIGIAVTDVQGRFFRDFPNEVYLDNYPRWGPTGTILFQRSRLGNSDWRDYRVMVLDLETGAVRELVEPEVVDGAVGLMNPDYRP